MTDRIPSPWDYRSPVGYAHAVHRAKHVIYGDSWRKRGETVSILANIARKVDRLGRAGAGDTELDTRLDLVVYLAKYVYWLQERASASHVAFADPVLLYSDFDITRDHEDAVRSLLLDMATYTECYASIRDSSLINSVEACFNALIEAATRTPLSSPHSFLLREDALSGMIRYAWALYYRAWTEERRARMMWNPTMDDDEEDGE